MDPYRLVMDPCCPQGIFPELLLETVTSPVYPLGTGAYPPETGVYLPGTGVCPQLYQLEMENLTDPGVVAI